MRAIGVPIARQARALISYAHECVRKCVRTGARPPKDYHFCFYLHLCARRPTLRAHGARTCARTIGGDGLRDRIKRVHSVQILRNAQHSLLNNLNLDGTLTVSTITWTARPKETAVSKLHIPLVVSRSAIPSYRSTIVATAVRAILVVLAKAVWIEPRRTRWGVRLWWKAEGCRENGTGIVSHYSEVLVIWGLSMIDGAVCT